MPEPVAEPALNGLRLNLRIVSVVIFNFASYLTIGLPLAVLPGYVHDVMGFSAFWAGLVISLQYFATLLSRPHAGRYADLLVHRALSFTLGATPWPILAGHKLLMAADQCNARERAATEAEREIARRLGCLLLRERTGETFTGVVSGVTEFGFFVEFDEMPVEGMVRLTTFRDDWFEYDPDRQELIGVGTGRRFRLGQAVTVRLTDVHIGRLEVNLELEGTTDTAKRSSSRRSAGGREAPGRSSGRKRNGFVPRHKRR